MPYWSEIPVLHWKLAYLRKRRKDCLFLSIQVDSTQPTKLVEFPPPVSCSWNSLRKLRHTIDTIDDIYALHTLKCIQEKYMCGSWTTIVVGSNASSASIQDQQNKKQTSKWDCCIWRISKRERDNRSMIANLHKKTMNREAEESNN